MSLTDLKNLQQLDDFLGSASPDQISVIDFHAEWCGPCHMIAPTYDALSQKHSNVKFFRCDVDAARDVAQKYGISAMPTFIFLKGKEQAESIRGANKAALESTVAKFGAGGFPGAGNTLGSA